MLHAYYIQLLYILHISVTYNYLDLTRDKSVLISKSSRDLLFTQVAQHVFATLIQSFPSSYIVILYTFINSYIQYNIRHNIQGDT